MTEVATARAGDGEDRRAGGTALAGKRLFLVDGSGFIFRAFHALPPMTRPDGTPVNAVYGFTAMLMKLIDEMDADYLAVIFDAKQENFRNDIYAEYKAHRPPPPEELLPQFPLIYDAVRAFGVPCIELEGYEADDLIATYARQAVAQGMQVVVVSSDKDLMQIVGEHVHLYDTMKNKETGVEQVREYFGVGPDKVIDVQSLAGDSVDNVPGVPGIGVKTAAQLINEYGDLETLLARADEIKQPKRRQNLIEYRAQALISRDLVTLKDDVPVPEPLDDFAVREPDPARLLAFLRSQAFRSIAARVEARLGAGEAVAAVSGDASAPAVSPPQPAAEAEYELVQDEAALSGWIAAATRAGAVGFDTETTSLDGMLAELVGVSLALAPGKACYVPLAHRAPAAQGALALEAGTTPDGTGTAAPKQIARERALALLKPLLEDPSVLKVGHNVKYDAQILAGYGIALQPFDCTMLLSFVLDGGRHGHGLDELASVHLDHKAITYADVAGSGRNQVAFDLVPLAAACDYAAEDADITLRLHGLLRARLLEDRMVTVYETLERPLVPVLAAMERCGVRVDPAALRALSRDFEQRMAALEEEICTLAGGRFNIGSPKQLGEILFERMSLPGGKKTRTGAYGTDARVLEDLAAAGHDLPARVLDWRQLAKLKSTYADALVQQIHPRTNRIHTCFMMTGAQTGRLSSTDPNLQNIPVRTEEGRKIRNAFVAADGYKLLSLDYSQIELRVLAHMAGIEALIDAFREGHDIHAMTASQVFGVPMEGMDPIVRRNAKAINFGIIYGISPFGLARQIGVSQGEARAYIDAYFERYPGIRAYMDGMRAQCKRTGYVTTLFGRRVHLPGINDGNPARRGYAERQAINAPIQGTAADIIKRAMIRVPPALECAGLGARMLLQVHDELVFEVPESEVPETIATVRAVMEGAAAPRVDLKTPLVVDAGVGDTWNEAH